MMAKWVPYRWRLGVALGFALCAVSSVWSAEPEPNASIASGKELFGRHCASCHGEDGKGSGPAAAALKNQPANLTRISANHDNQFPRAEIIHFIDGERPVPAHGPRHMPIWGEVFRNDQSDSVARLRLHSLTAYIESIQQQ
jgi:mono/diheme cytochrome c family protein